MFHIMFIMQSLRSQSKGIWVVSQFWSRIESKSSGWWSSRTVYESSMNDGGKGGSSSSCISISSSWWCLINGMFLLTFELHKPSWSCSLLPGTWILLFLRLAAIIVWPEELPWWRSFFFLLEFQKFLIALSVLPGKCFAICAHLF